MRSLYFLFFLLGFSNATLTAQESNAIKLYTDSILSLSSGVNTLDVQLQNNDSNDFEGSLTMDLPNGLQSLLSESISLSISAKKKRFLSLKLKSGTLSLLKDQFLYINVLDAKGKRLQRQKITLVVPEKRSVILQNLTDFQYLRQIGDSVYVKVKVINTGTTNEEIRLLFSSPDRIGNRNFESVALMLVSGQESLINISFPVEKFMLNLGQYTIRVTGVYEGNDTFGNIPIVFSNISSSRNYATMFGEENGPAVYSNNYIDLQANNLLDKQRIYFLRSEGEYRVGSGQLKYNAFINQVSDFRSPPSINSTFIQYTQGNTNFTVGNIQENLESVVYGRGIRVEIKDSLSANSFVAGIVEKSNDLLGLYSNGSPGLTLYSKLVLMNEMTQFKRYEGQLYYDRSSQDSTESILWANSFDFLRQELSDRVQLKGFVGAGVNTYFAESGKQDVAAPSIALGLKFYGKLGKRWTYTADNFFSSPYYTGNRRGALQFIHRANRSFKKNNIGVGYFYSRFSPEFVNPRLINYSNSNSRIDMTWTYPLSAYAGITVMPSYNQESGRYFLQEGPTDLNSNTSQLTSSVHIRSKNFKHHLFTTAETGLLSVQQYATEDWFVRGNMSYNYGKVGLFGTYQKGAIQLFEVLNSHILNRPFGDRWSFGGLISGSWLSNKLLWNSNLSLNRSSTFGNTYSFNANTDYKVKRHTSITAAVQYSYVKGAFGYGYDYNNIRIGVRQNFKSRDTERPAESKGTLKVFCFYDQNNNDIFDEGDIIATGYNFIVKNILFFADKKGESTFKNMPYGEYTAIFPISEGYQASTQTILINKKNTYISVPLHKAGTVQGRVNLHYDPKLNLSTDLALDVYKIHAKSSTGRVYTVSTNRNGEFEFNLPHDHYEVYMDENSFPEYIFTDKNLHQVTVETGQTVSLPSFDLKVKNKAIEVKRF